MRQFDYSSVDRGGPNSDKDPTDVPHFASKYRVEQYLFKKTEAGQMDWTVLRPVGFYENLVPGFFGKVFSTSWKITLPKDKPLQLVATSDIGYFVQHVNADRSAFANDRFSAIRLCCIVRRKINENIRVEETTGHSPLTGRI